MERAIFFKHAKNKKTRERGGAQVEVWYIFKRRDDFLFDNFLFGGRIFFFPF
jgi:hypothetical protein